jgi:biotin carboxylase
MNAEPKQSTIIIVGGGIETENGVEAAQNMGLRVVVVDQNPQAPCVQMEDVLPVIASTYDAEDAIRKLFTLRKTANVDYDGVLSIGSDVPKTVCAIANAFNLTSINPIIADWCSDKEWMKRKLQDAGIRVPWFKEIFSYETLVETVRANDDCLLVIKPVDSRGARGVIRLLPSVDLKWAYQESLSYSPSERVMVERWLDGPQYSTESVHVSGQMRAFACIERNYAQLDKYTPYAVENGGANLVGCGGIVEPDLAHLQDATAKALGIYNWTLKGDLVIHHGLPYVIEVAPRLSGGFMSTTQIPLGTGMRFVESAINLAMGKKPQNEWLTPTKEQGVAIRYFFPNPGKVVDIEQYGWPDGLQKFEIFTRIGATVVEPICHPQRAGYVICTGKDKAEAEKNAEEAIKCWNIVTV